MNLSEKKKKIRIFFLYIGKLNIGAFVVVFRFKTYLAGTWKPQKKFVPCPI